MKRRPHFLQPLLDRPAGPFSLRLARLDTPIATRLEPAFDSASRRRGLLGRNSLAPGTALIIAPCNAVHTFFMRFSIDLVFAARDGRVVKTRHAVPPWRVSAAVRAFAVIELPAGTAVSMDIRVDDRLIVAEF